MSMRGAAETKEKQVIQELRSRLSAKPDLKLEDVKLKSDKFLKRFLRHNKWNVDKAEKVLDNYMNIITQLNAELEVDSAKKYPKEIRDMYKPYFGGTDHENQPVFFVPDLASINLQGFLEHADDKTVSLLQDYMMRFRTTVEKLVLDKDADYAVGIVDLANVKYSQLLCKKSFHFFIDFAKKIEGHSPGVTGKLILLNAPRVVKTIVTMAQKIMTFSTQLVIYGANETDWKTKLRDHAPESGLIPEFGGTLSAVLFENI